MGGALKTELNKVITGQWKINTVFPVDEKHVEYNHEKANPHLGWKSRNLQINTDSMLHKENEFVFSYFIGWVLLFSIRFE